MLLSASCFFPLCYLWWRQNCVNKPERSWSRAQLGCVSVHLTQSTSWSFIPAPLLCPLSSPEQERDSCFLTDCMKRVDYVILVARWPDHKMHSVSLDRLQREAPGPRAVPAGPERSTELQTLPEADPNLCRQHWLCSDTSRCCFSLLFQPKDAGTQGKLCSHLKHTHTPMHPWHP